MSKFTKALEKIQKSRTESPAVPKSPLPTVDLDDVSALAKEPARWDRGIQAAKNAAPDKRLVVHHFSESTISEQYRMLACNLKNQLDQVNGKVVLISSSIHAEGKSITAANLALALAEDTQKKVALIDADLRRGRLTEYFGLEKRDGLSELLSSTNGLTARKLLVKALQDNLVLLSCGAHAKSAGRLIGAEKLREIIAEFRVNYDYVIVDAPPIMPVADAGTIGKLADGLIMIIQVGRTPKSVISHSIHLFKQAGIRLLGYILTNVEFQTADYKYYYNYYNTEDSRKSRFRTWLRLQLERVGLAFQTLEERFNEWWDRKVLKK